MMAGPKRKVLLTLIAVGLTASAAGLGTFSAFSGTTSNSGNSFAAGTVVIGDDDAGAAMYSVSNQKPGANTVRCIKVTYTGSLDADVKLYTTTTTIPASGSNISLTVEKGTATGATFPNCGTYTSEATIYSGNLFDFQQNKNSFANGIATNPGSATKWVTNDALVFRFTLSVGDGGSGVDSGSHQFTWDARNQ